MRGVSFLPVLLLAFAAAGPAFSQASITGMVRGARSQTLPEADVQVQSESTGARWKARSDERGLYTVRGLRPGTYKVTVRLAGFRTVSRGGVSVAAGDHVTLDFTLDLLALHEVITVVNHKEALDPSGGDTLLITRTSPGAALPSNGHDYRASFDLMRGVVVTPASVSDAGQFTSNGQRPNANSFRVDGASANTGVGGTILPGSFPGASLPSMNAIGSTENLGTLEGTQSVEFQSAGFTAEWGTRPGAEAHVITRSGSPEFHGDLFADARDNSWIARDWFANSAGFAYQRPSYHRLGLVFGGPIRRNRTFFFFSLERSTLADTGMQLVAVPSLASRQTAPDKLKPILDYFPYPTGPDLGAGEALSVYGNTSSGRLSTGSLRVDHSLGQAGNLFARVVLAPSAATYLQNNFITSDLNWASATVGLTAGGSAGFVHDARINFSRATLSSGDGSSAWATSVLVGSGLLPGAILSTSYGNELIVGQIPPELTALLPASGANNQTLLGLSVPGLGQFVSNIYGTARQDQWELRDTLSWTRARHEFRTGADYILLQPSRDATLNSVLGVAASLESLLANDPLAVTYSQATEYGGRVHTVSTFAQDTFRVNRALSIVYGLRWEITPPTSSHLQIPTVTGLWTGSAWQTSHSGDISGSAPWPMRFRQIAPRVGIAWGLPWRGLVLRAGGGLFYDAALGTAVNPINGAPFNSWLLAAGGPGIDASTGVPGTQPPSAASSPDVASFLLGASPPLHLPASYQWRAALEKSFRARGTASLAYIGATGRDLLGNQAYVEPATGILDRRVALTQSSSNYQAAQFRYSGTLARDLYGSVSYTWSHSIDNGSEDSSLFLIHPGYRLGEARGSSAFDIRHQVTAALSYRIRAPRLHEALRDWTISGILRARSGFPIDVLTTQPPLGQGFNNAGRPDLVPGMPIWVADPSVAGHRRLNPAAFLAPASGLTGNLGRDAVTGNGLTQFDASLRREFHVFRQISAEVRLDIFNVLNHPAFANPVPYLSSPLFGQATSMQNLMLGSGTPNTGLPPLFQTGGSRSGEFSFRFSF